jgi:dTDP-4-dehydrorhamnose reductase
MTVSKGRPLLVLGASGMLGNAMLRWFAQDPSFQVFGSVRNLGVLKELQQQAPQAQLVTGFDVETEDGLTRLFAQVRPEIVINCIGVVKQLAGADDPLIAIPINALLPHRLAGHCRRAGVRLVHISTDCVFSGERGGYQESDRPDALDLYGRSKLLGEVLADHVVTLRTSIVGHELASGHGLLGWFLVQSGSAPGFTRAISTAMPTVELARVIQRYVIPDISLHGVFHVGAEALSKQDLLSKVAHAYQLKTQLVPTAFPVIDRSLDCRLFEGRTGYRAPTWDQLAIQMRDFG